MKKLNTYLLLLSIIFVSFIDASAKTWYVKTGSTGTGSSWEATTNLSYALNNAVAGDEIWVSSGTHKPTTTTNRTVSFTIKEGIKVYGGFAGNETSLSQRNWYRHKTILSGDIGTINENNDNSYQVVKFIGSEETPITNNTVLDGFFIQDGYANGTTPANNGAGIYLDRASPIIKNIWIKDNFAQGQGGLFLQM
jgi:hypothetical protein